MTDPQEIWKTKMRDKVFHTPKSTSSIGTNLSLLAQYDDMIRMTQPPLINLTDLKALIGLIENFDKCRVNWQQTIEDNQQKDRYIEKLEDDAKQMQIRWDRIKRAYAREIKEKDNLQKCYDNLKKKMDILRQMILEQDGQKTSQIFNQTMAQAKSTSSLISILEHVDTLLPPNDGDESDDGLLFDKSDDSIDCNRTFKTSKNNQQIPSAPPLPSSSSSENPAKSTTRQTKLSTMISRSRIETIAEVSDEKDASDESLLNVGFCMLPDTTQVKKSNILQTPASTTAITEKNDKFLKPSMRSISEAATAKSLNRNPSKQLSRTITMLRNAQTTRLEAERLGSRSHRFSEKKAFKTVICTVCNKSIGFCSSYGVCTECRGSCHNRCRDKLPKPCLPYMSTNTSIKKMIALTGDSRMVGGKFLIIGDFVPDSVRPCVPPLLIHCCNEIDRRIRLDMEDINRNDDSSVIGLYRISGTDMETRELRRKILKSEFGMPNLSAIISVHTICGVVKMFLRDLDDSLISRIMWNDFYRASVHIVQTSVKSLHHQFNKPIDSGVDDNGSSGDNEHDDDDDDMNSPTMVLKRVICQLPLPNRDSLAFLILHLRNVANAERVTKMTRQALCNIFAPTIVGSSEFRQLSAEAMQREIPKQINVMQALFEVDEAFWRGILTEQNFCPFKEKSDQYCRKSLCSSEEQADFCAKLARISSSNLKDLLNSKDNAGDDDDDDTKSDRRNRVLPGMNSCIVTTGRLNTTAINRRSIIHNLKDSLY
ncbi:Rac GTPase-activating protein 1 [Dermatophagoides pteronyssinus]|uniref:Rac GTPase-activating protein 1 n=2 Tax=Dermatophagoides pteronyssinus TaxID=6956 RepID=A0ABQ8J6W1_DERPT|nr:rac GTPase-activating protein 1-like [Dermatophagoides pteronyssinus]KAH9418091.1 Rac GTPase-activating protein 1 [Dermatophagoides pteronyssinus]